MSPEVDASSEAPSAGTGNPNLMGVDGNPVPANPRPPSTVVDFDEAFAAAAEPLRIRLFGRVWDLPATLPADTVLQASRHIDAGKIDPAGLKEGELVELSVSLFPERIFKEWLAQGLTIDQLIELVDWAVRQYVRRMGVPGGPAGRAEASA